MRILILCAVVMLLFACGSGDSVSESAAPADHVLQGQQQSLEAAREAAESLQQAAQAEAERIEKIRQN